MPVTSMQSVAFALIGAYLLGDPAQITQVTARITADGRPGEVLDAAESILDRVFDTATRGKDQGQLDALEGAAHQRLAAMLPTEWEPIVARVIDTGFPDDPAPPDPALVLAAVHVLAAYTAEVTAQITPPGEFAAEAMAMLAEFHAGHPS